MFNFRSKLSSKLLMNNNKYNNNNNFTVIFIPKNYQCSTFNLDLFCII